MQEGMSKLVKLILVGAMLCIQIAIVSGQIPPVQPVTNRANITDLSKYSGVILEQYANGRPFLHKTVKNGKADGIWLEWYADGTLRYKANWKNNMGEGKWEYFHPNGQLRSEGFYIQDKAFGIFRTYYNNGVLETDATYENDKKVGVEKLYAADGTLQTRLYFENGVQAIDEPTLFEAGKISTKQNNEWGIQFSPSGDTAYFTRRNAETKQKRIYSSYKTKSGWSNPTVASFSTAEDESAFVSPSGNELFFASYRPLPTVAKPMTNDMNIWVTKKQGTNWTDPTPLSANINQTMQAGDSWPNKYEAGPITDAQGNLYYWTKSNKWKASNLFFAERKQNGTFTNPIELVELGDSLYFNSAPCISPDGNLLFFASDNRPQSWGTDLYYARKINGKWSQPKNMGIAINSYSDDSFPSFSPDGKYFYFSSNRAGNKDANGEAIWDLYYMETRFLVLE
ncbi:MAG: hypothetical protein EAY72_14145 [Bacteroidetes bacterium]|nr:MAG: hypothetical protein EAY72_14145 [Bacteroidota bacterium]